MPNNNEPKNFAASQDLVQVQAILPERHEGDGAVMRLKDGSFRMLIRCGTINFDMKGKTEREGITIAFGNMVDGLTTDSPIQIASHAKQLDTEAYVRQYQAALANERTPPQLRGLIKAHIEHYETQVKAENLLTRELYVVVPWKRIGGPVTESIADQFPFSGLFKEVSKTFEKKYQTVGDATPEEAFQARQNLSLRSDDIMQRLTQMGTWAYRLNEAQLRRLLYELYHPGLSQIQKDVDLSADRHIMPSLQIRPREIQQAPIQQLPAIEPPRFQ